MAAKRILDDQDHMPSEKRMRTGPSFASIIGEVVMVNSMRHFCSALEPLLRRVVNEEMERGLIRNARILTRSPSLRIQALEQPSTVRLIFNKKLSLPIFTSSKIGDAENNPLQILLVDTSNGQMIPTNLPYPIKIEIVVLDGDFEQDHAMAWTSEEFNDKIVKERTGKRPLLTGGELCLTMRDGIVSVGEIEFTDNSSWIRSRRFRIGARVANGSCQGVRIGEAMTEAFVVKDHRGELYKKHHPPSLHDKVWRLEKIGKDGAFHRKLSNEGIDSVQDFLKMSVVDPAKLKAVLGVGMSEKMWEVTFKHARTCTMGTKYYTLRASSNITIFFNPICQVVKAMIDGQFYSTRDLINIINKGYIENLVKEAYSTWNSLEVVDGLVLNDTTPLLSQGEVVHYSKSSGMEHVGSSNWATYTGTIENALYSNFTDSSSDGGDLTTP